MNFVNAISTLVIAIATIVATRATVKMTSIENNREIASNAIYAWIEHSQLYISNGDQGVGHNSLKLHARTISSFPAYQVSIELVLDKAINEFKSLKVGQVLFEKHFSVLFENDKKMLPINLNPDDSLSSILRDSLKSIDNFEKNRITFQNLANNLKAQITFTDINGVRWHRDTQGKLKRLKN